MLSQLTHKVTWPWSEPTADRTALYLLPPTGCHSLLRSADFAEATCCLLLAFSLLFFVSFREFLLEFDPAKHDHSKSSLGNNVPRNIWPAREAKVLTWLVLSGLHFWLVSPIPQQIQTEGDSKAWKVKNAKRKMQQYVIYCFWFRTEWSELQLWKRAHCVSFCVCFWWGFFPEKSPTLQRKSSERHRCDQRKESDFLFSIFYFFLLHLNSNKMKWSVSRGKSEGPGKSKWMEASRKHLVNCDENFNLSHEVNLTKRRRRHLQSDRGLPSPTALRMHPSLTPASPPHTHTQGTSQLCPDCVTVI